MKTSTLVLTASVVVNAGCFALLLIKPRLAPPAVRDFLPAVFHPEAGPVSATGQKSPVPFAPVAAAATPERVPRWSSFAAGDLSTLVANLRAAGFSPMIIRAIVSAQIESRFRDRMNALIGTVGETPFWKPDPMGTLSSSKLYAEYNQIYRERAALMRQLLGSDALADPATDVTAAQRRQFGDIPKNKVDLVQRIADDYAEMTSQVQSGTQGIVLPADREKLALLAREKHADLAAILTPEELEGYEMRTSTVTMRLRQALTLMDANEEEFRTIFRAQQPLTDVLYPTGGTMSADAAQQRTAAQKTLAETLKAALGEARYAEYVRANDYEYQSLVRIAQRENLPADRINAVYGLRETVAKESGRIYDDKQLGPEEKRAALATLGQSIKSQILGTLGQNAGTAFMQNAQWATAPERGWVVRTGADGQINSFMPLPAPAPPKPPTN